jgi:hypothetical protein
MPRSCQGRSVSRVALAPSRQRRAAGAPFTVILRGESTPGARRAVRQFLQARSLRERNGRYRLAAGAGGRRGGDAPGGPPPGRARQAAAPESASPPAHPPGFGTGLTPVAHPHTDIASSHLIRPGPDGLARPEGVPLKP